MSLKDYMDKQNEISEFKEKMAMTLDNDMQRFLYYYLFNVLIVGGKPELGGWKFVSDDDFKMAQDAYYKTKELYPLA